MKAFEAKDEQLQKIRFEAVAEFNDKGSKFASKQLYLRLNELVMGKINHLFTQQKVAKYDERVGNFVFPRFEFTSDISRSRMPVPMKTFVIEIFEVDPKNQRHKFFGKTQFLMRDAMRKGHTGKMSLFILDEKNKYQGKFEISQCSARRHYSYFDLQLRS